MRKSFFSTLRNFPLLMTLANLLECLDPCNRRLELLLPCLPCCPRMPWCGLSVYLRGDPLVTEGCCCSIARAHGPSISGRSPTTFAGKTWQPAGREARRAAAGLERLTHGTGGGQAGPAQGIVVHGIYREFFPTAVCTVQRM